MLYSLFWKTNTSDDECKSMSGGGTKCERSGDPSAIRAYVDVFYLTGCIGIVLLHSHQSFH